MERLFLTFFAHSLTRLAMAVSVQRNLRPSLLCNEALAPPLPLVSYSYSLYPQPAWLPLPPPLCSFYF